MTDDAPAPAGHRQRLDAAADLADGDRLDALLVTDLVHVRYLCGFTGTNGAVVVSGGRRIFCSDFRYRAQAERQVTECEWHEVDRDLFASVGGVLGDISPARVGFDDAHMTVKQHRALVEHLPRSIDLVPAAGLVERLRQVKDESEVAAMRRAARIADGALADLLEHGLVGRTERSLARFLEDRMRDRGADGIAFPSIVASGANGALPHAEPTDAVVGEGVFVTVDFGATVGGYNSDCTRTFATGDVTFEAKEVYEVVRRAQAAAAEAARPGARASQVDRVARDIISEAGYGEAFGHSLGHGVGLEVHEGPVLSSRSDAPLATGNAVTVEPGIYLEGKFGVRIEDLLVIREGHPEVLTRHARDLERVEVAA